MNYQHAFHAGSAADVFKHVVLLALLEALQNKDTPFCYIDTHAGTSLYDLTDVASQKTGEYLDGICKILDQPLHSTLIKKYIALVKACNSGHGEWSDNIADNVRNKDRKNPKENIRKIAPSKAHDHEHTVSPKQLQYPGSPYKETIRTTAPSKAHDHEHTVSPKQLQYPGLPYKETIRTTAPSKAQDHEHIIHPKHLRFYPGSPYIARSCLRKNDRMIVMDFHPDVYQQLKQAFVYDKQVHVHHHDGYLALKAFLPPKERRGLVLIDPPYEDAQEFTRLREYLAQALQRWSTGIYAIWYPIKNRSQITAWQKLLIQKDLPSTLVTELCPWPDDVATRLNGSGMIIVNPPWQLDSLLTATLPELLSYLQCHVRASTSTWWLKN
jgi:23S rRNA A2030 N6-methylase RlmJ